MAIENNPAEKADASLICVPASFVERLNLVQLFPQSQPLEVELGSGDGSFLVQWALARPHRNFLGVERLLGRLRKIDRKGRRLGLRNLRVLRIEAAYFVEYLLPPASVNAFHIYHPDPWPKRKHWPKRLINSRFTELAAHALAPAGIVYLRTDDAPYFAQMNEVFGQSPQFQPVDTPPELRAVLTDFEREFLARGRAVHRAAYRKV